MQSVKYARASSVSEATQLLANGGATARVLAGGTDVIVQARERVHNIDLFVDIKHIPETMSLSYDPGEGLTVGAAVPCYQIYGHDQVREHYPALADATNIIGGTAIRGRASLGGNLCNSSPAADIVPAMIALEGVARIAGASAERNVPVENFCTDPGKNVLQADEFVVSLHFPLPSPHSGTGWQRFIPRNEMDIAVANAACQLRFEDNVVSWARVVIGAVAPTALLVAKATDALVGKPLTDETVGAAATASSTASRPIADMRGSIKQRKHLAAVLTERTIRIAAERALGS